MFAKRDEHYPSRSEETNLATEATYFSKPVTKVNFGPSKIHKAALVHLFGIPSLPLLPSLPLYLDVMYVSSKGAGEVFIWTTDRSGVSKEGERGREFQRGECELTTPYFLSQLRRNTFYVS